MSKSTKKTTTKDAPTHHETATYRFLPFTVDVFSRRELRLKRSALMPVGRGEDLTQEVVQALEQVVSRGTLAFLCRQGGWRSLSWARPGREEPHRDTRLIDRRVWGGLQLMYGDESLDALLMAYNAVCQQGGQTPPPGPRKGRRRGAYPMSKAMRFESNGDLLVHHILWSKLASAPFTVDAKYWTFFKNNALTKVARLDAEHEPEKALARLLEPDFEPILPWLGTHLMRCWLRQIEGRGDRLENFNRVNQGMVTYFEGLLEVSRTQGRRDLLVPVLEFFRAHFAKEDIEHDWLRTFNRLTRDFRFADRDEYRRLWGRAMRMGWTLFEEYGSARAIHPVDRESPDRVYMEAFERHDFEEQAHRARALSNQLNSVIS